MLDSCTPDTSASNTERAVRRQQGKFRSATRRFVTSAALAGAVMSTAAFAAPTAASAAYIGSNVGFANVKSCPYTWCGQVTRLYNNQGVNMIRWCDSQWVYTGYPNYADYNSPRWFKINWPATGWVHSSFVEGQNGVPWGCS